MHYDRRLFEYLFEQEKNHPLAQAFGHKRAGAWRYLSTHEMVALTNRAAAGLLQMGVRPGDKIATVVHQCSPEWVALDFAMLQIGVLNVPMYPSISAREYAYILQESEAVYCIVGDSDLYAKVADARQNAPLLKNIYTFEEHAEAAPWTDLLAEPDADMKEVARIRDTIRPDDVCTIIYTSGTTGNPKGVMLTHKNIAFNVEAMRRLLPIEPGERGLSFLPVSHIFERAVVYAYTAYCCSVTFTGTDNLGGEEGDLQQIKPHFFSTVPRLLEKVYEKIMARGLDLKGFKRAMFFWSVRLTEDWAFDKSYSGLKRLQWSIAHALIFSKWRKGLGGSLKGIITGANACPERIMRTFNAAGIPIREGYGMTEAAPAVSFSRFEPGGAMLGTVGRLLEGVQVRIENAGDYLPDEGEILVSGPGVMEGYFKQPEATTEVIRYMDGLRWYATGDVGMLVPDGKGQFFLKITDRKKELLKTSGGKFVAPTPIEARFKEHYLVEQVMVVGESLKFVSALIVPSVEGLRQWCQKHDMPWTSLREMIQNPQVQQRYQMLVDRINPYFSHVEQIKKFALLPETWEPEKTDGTEAELTPTLKLKRRVIMKKYRQVIDGLYGG